ncbi:ATP-binding cassette domain-containing protein [Actibacterium lipolyticum]|uniref:Sulfate/thiosulfate import ATP-binding protein CysA n=1 Tax=Actibacterium lipolyticum TaxID=1524263 RepID=A0A238JWI6_9RHOB|nr:ATP-binding cassette domain-containing protein [Actibacterium lipolyticum]SMX34557.1 Sulfate/thiosulfate import ATP-binding protein CysA [Actibacterium lipolyticum]
MNGAVANTQSKDSGNAVLSLDLQGMSFKDTPILGALSFQVFPHETLAITGPSGVGKSTLLRIIAGLERRFKGDVQAPDNIGFVFQEPTLLPWRNARQNICLTAHVDATIAEAALGEVGLGGLGDRFPMQLSLGQQRRLSLARAFASRPAVLLMDEPFVSLDPALSDEMMSVFEDLRARTDVATVLVTHVEAEANRLASRIITLEGTPAQIVDERQNAGAYFQLSASGVTSSRS